MSTTTTSETPVLTWTCRGAGFHTAGRYIVRKDHRPGVDFWAVRFNQRTVATTSTLRAGKAAAEAHAAERAAAR